jgi:PAS domain S-box-containing protein
METKLNKLLARQLKRHFGSVENLPEELKGFIQEINETYVNFDDDTQLLQNSIEISSQELRDAFLKQKKDTEAQKETIDKIQEAIFALTQAGQGGLVESENIPADSKYLFDSLIRLIEERVHMEEALHDERALFRTILDLIPDAVYVKDISGRKIFANPKEVQFSGKTSEEEIIGKTDFQLLPEVEAKNSLEQDEYVIRNIKPILNTEGTLIDKEEKLHSLLCSKVPLLDRNGKITGIVGITHDITERKLAEDSLKQLSTRLALAVRAGGVGVWDWDLVNNVFIWDEQMFALYGVRQDEFSVAYDTWLSGLFIEDSAMADKEIRMAINGEKEFNTEFRVLWPDGSIHTIRALATVQRDENGKPLRMVGTNWDITEQKNTEETLVLAKLESDAASKAKSEFLANMSHEIRTPLNGVIGFTDLLLKTTLNKMQKQYAENANTSGHALLGIINDILDFSKIEAGKMELDFIRTDIIELVEQTTDIIKYHASKKGLELLLNIQQDVPRFAVVDPMRLKQILVNLLGNAVKFTETGEVEMKITFVPKDKTSGAFCFSVRDTGIGVSEDQQKLLFKAFSQADTSTTRKFGGTGLGLAISNMLAGKMGSEIEITSQKGKGSNFYFTLETNFEEGEKPDCSNLANISRVLVVDDNVNCLRILGETFKSWGIDFTGLNSCQSARERLENSDPFDVILVDNDMPYPSGIQTIRMMREEFALTPAVQPIILMHNSSEDNSVHEEGKKLELRFFLSKPVKSMELFAYLSCIQNQPVEISRKPKKNLLDLTIDISGGRSPVVLIAEDVALNRVLARTLIRQMIPSANVLEAKSGTEAIDMAISLNPDLILMDVQMPERSGIEATIEIRKYELISGSRIPIVALTAGAITGEREKCLKAGMNDFITKPIDRDALARILKHYLTAL